MRVYWCICFLFLLCLQETVNSAERFALEKRSRTDGVEVERDGDNAMRLTFSDSGGSSSSGGSSGSGGSGGSSGSGDSGGSSGSGDSGGSSGSNSGGGISGAASSIMSTGENVVGSVASTLGGAVKGAVGGVGQVGKKAAGTASNAADGIANGAAGGLKSAVGAVGNVFGTAMGTVGNVGNNLQTTVKNAGKMVQGMGLKLITVLRNAVSAVIIRVQKGTGQIVNLSGSAEYNLKDFQVFIKGKVDNLIDFLSQPQQKLYAMARQSIQYVFEHAEAATGNIHKRLVNASLGFDGMTYKLANCVNTNDKDIPNYLLKNAASCLVGKVNQVIGVGGSVMKDVRLISNMIYSLLTDVQACSDFGCFSTAVVKTAKSGATTILNVVGTVATVGSFGATLVPSIPLCFGQQVGIKTPFELGKIVFNVGKCMIGD